MHDAPGVGLAAPQVGVLQRLLVYDVDDDPRVLVNPVLDEFSDETEESRRGLPQRARRDDAGRAPGEPPRARARPARRSAGLPRRGFRGARHPARERPPRRRPHLDRTSSSARAAALRALRETRPRFSRPPAAALSRMRFAYAGTAPFAALVLAGLAPPGTRRRRSSPTPDRPRGRHGTPQPPRSRQLAPASACPSCSPSASTTRRWRAARRTRPTRFVVCAYGQIVAAAGPRRRRDHRRAPVAGAALARRGAGGARAHGRRDRARRVHAAHDGRGRRGPRRRRCAWCTCRARPTPARPTSCWRRPAAEGAAGHARRPSPTAASSGGRRRASRLRRQDRRGRPGDRLEPAGRGIADQVRALSPAHRRRRPSSAGGARASGARVRRRRAAAERRPRPPGHRRPATAGWRCSSCRRRAGGG